MVLNERQYIRMNATGIHHVPSDTRTYRIQSGTSQDTCDGLLDGGASGGAASTTEMTFIETVPNAVADVVSVTGEVLPSLPIGCGAARIETLDHGMIVGLFPQYANFGSKGRTVHSKTQLTDFGCAVFDDVTDPTPSVVTPEGYVVPLEIRDGLHYMKMKPATEEDMSTLPTVYFCSDEPWNPSKYDRSIDLENYTIPQVALDRRAAQDNRVNEVGDYHHRDLLLHTVTALMSAAFLGTLTRAVNVLSCFPTTVKTRRFPDLDALRPNFGWMPVDRIKRTLELTTQHFRAAMHYSFRKHFKTRFPAANVRRLPEWVATDTIFWDTPALDDGVTGHGGATMLQLWAAMESHYLVGYPMRSESEIPHTLEEYIREHGAMRGIRSDQARSETQSIAIRDIRRLYKIDDSQSEPYCEWQNPAERKIQDVKRITKNIMDRTGAPSKVTLLCILFVIGLLNHMVNADGVIPHSVFHGVQTDISPLHDLPFLATSLCG